MPYGQYHGLYRYRTAMTKGLHEEKFRQYDHFSVETINYTGNLLINDAVLYHF